MKARIAPEPERRRWLVLAVTVAAQFMVIVDVAVVNVALPAIKNDLHFSQDSLQWVITAYSILFGGMLLLGGRLADLLGRRRLFTAGVAVFTVGSLLSGLAWSEGALIVTRGLQGLGGALLAPAALSIVVTTFREGHERNIALGVWGAASGVGGAVGVLLGGVLTSYLGWSWIFFVNLPVGAAILAVTPWLVRESRAAVAQRYFDVAGATSITAGLMLLVYAITRTSTNGWSDGMTLGLLATAARVDRGVRRDRGALAGAALAAADLPPADALGGQRGDADGRCDRVLPVLPDHAVSAGGPPLLGDRDGCRLHRHHRHDHRLLEHRSGADHPAGGTPGAERRLAAHRRRRRALRSDARRRALLLGRLPRPDPEWHRSRALVRAGHDRQPHRSPAGRRRRRLRARQHQPADRGRGRTGRRDHDCRHRDKPLCLEPRGARLQRPRSHARVPRCLLCVDRGGACRGGGRRCVRRVEAQGGSESDAGRGSRSRSRSRRQRDRAVARPGPRPARRRSRRPVPIDRRRRCEDHGRHPDLEAPRRPERQGDRGGRSRLRRPAPRRFHRLRPSPRGDRPRRRRNRRRSSSSTWRRRPAPSSRCEAAATAARATAHPRAGSSSTCPR